MEALIEARGLGKAYSGFSLEGVSFALEPGYVMGLIGENGAGKTTTIKLLMGMIRRGSGYLSVFGLDPERDGAAARERIGFVSDENWLWEDIRVDRAVKVLSRFFSHWDQAAFDARFEEFGLPARKAVKELSRGMRVKLNLAIALSHGAELLILDEPSSGLDPVARDEFMLTLRDFVSDGKRAVLFSTHITSDLDKIADYVTFIRNGRVVFSMDKASMEETFAVVKGGGSLPEAARGFFIGVKETGVGFEGLVRDKEGALRALGGGCAAERANIEQIMLYHGKE
jgi:ABC-2 type transport system ATP-binding protein